MLRNVPKDTQITPWNNFPVIPPSAVVDTLERWTAAYFEVEVTTMASSQQAQRRDIGSFIDFCRREAGDTERIRWTPRLSKAYQTFVQSSINDKGKRRWSDKSINRMLAHVKTFAKFIHRMRPFPLGNPMTKIKLQAVGNGLDIERAVTPQERNRILDAADALPITGWRSKDRNRFKGEWRPQRKNFRPYRNRAVVYVLLETGMRRAAVTNITLADVNFEKRSIIVVEKGGHQHEYKISNDGLEAVRKYLELERGTDFENWKSPALFLAAQESPHWNGQLNVKAINTIWNQVCAVAGVSGRTPHSARHAMGKYLVEKTGNIAAVQRQLGHKNAAYSMQYSRITGEELSRVLDERG